MKRVKQDRVPIIASSAMISGIDDALLTRISKVAVAASKALASTAQLPGFPDKAGHDHCFLDSTS